VVATGVGKTVSTSVDFTVVLGTVATGAGATLDGIGVVDWIPTAVGTGAEVVVGATTTAVGTMGDFTVGSWVGTVVAVLPVTIAVRLGFSVGVDLELLAARRASEAVVIHKRYGML